MTRIDTAARSYYHRGMRGDDRQPATLLSYVSTESRVPADHPLRAIRLLVDGVLQHMSPEFDALYAAGGRPSIPPERLLRAQLLQMIYTVRSERLPMEQLDDNILFRWFVGLELDEPIWDVTVFTKNRDRLLTQAVAQRSFQLVVAQATLWLSDEHFTVDGTLLEAWASHKSFQRKDGDDDGEGRDFRGQVQKNDTHASKTDPDARLYRKSHGVEARLAYLGHVLMECLVVQAVATRATGMAEREAALQLVHAHGVGAGCTLGGRQELRHPRLRRPGAGARRHAPCQSEREAPRRERHRRAHHAARRLRPESGLSTAGRTGLRLDQTHRGPPQDQAPRARPRRMALRLRLRGLQREAPHGLPRRLGGRMSPQDVPRRRLGAATARAHRLIAPSTEADLLEQARCSANS